LAPGATRVGIKKGLTVLTLPLPQWTSHEPASPQAHNQGSGAWKEENGAEKRCAEEERSTQKKGINIFSGEEDGPAELAVSPWPFHHSFRIPLTTKAVLANFPDGVLYVIDRLPLEQMIRERCPSVGDRLRFVQTHSNDYFSIPNNLFDFAFSFGVFVHLPLREIEIILTRLRPKMRAGGEMILHYSNWDKLDRRGWERTDVPRWFKDSPDHPDVWWTKNSCETMKSISEKAGFIVLSPDLGYFDSCSVLHLRTRSCIWGSSKHQCATTNSPASIGARAGGW
jgi:hypothetical protein